MIRTPAASSGTAIDRRLPHPLVPVEPALDLAELDPIARGA